MSGDRSHSYSDILPVFREHFVKDFDSRDVEYTLRKILKPKEVDVIIKSLLPEQVYRLFWTLDNQDEYVVKNFVLNVPDYKFLMEKIKMEYVNPSPDTKTYFSAVARLNNDNQKFSKYNVPRMKPYLELQKALLNLSESKNVVIQGVLGAGKQWLALDVCSSYIVQRKMNFEIYWINVRDCHSAESRLEELQSFLYQLDPTYSCNSDQSIKLRIERIKIELRHRMQKKPKCLIVLCNVQNIKTWEDFNFGCKILLTTRHKFVANFLSPSTTTHITLDDALTPFEIESLFAKYLRNKHLELTERHHRYLKTTNPLKLSIIAENISEGYGTLDNWKNIDSINAELQTYILNSLNALKPNEDDDNLHKLYTNLFIFPESAQIPIRLLGIIWDVDDPMTIVNKFNNLSLVEKHSNNRSISIPDIYSELKLVNTNELVLNMKIVNYYNIPTLFSKYDDTTTLPNLDFYFYENIGHHLSKINDKNDRVQYFRMIFLDFRFLEQKIRNDTTPWAARGSILHTLRTLKCYRNQIVDNDPHYEQLFSALLEFLPKVEEKLIRSQYTSLLQIALMSEDAPVFDEALRQAKRFPNYVFFTEHGRFHQHRQIINLGEHQVQRAIYLNDDFCLMALNTSELLLTDVSLQGDLTHVLSDKNDHSSIIKMRVFNNEKHLLTLHSNGALKLWSLHQLLSSRDDMLGSRQKVQPPKVDWTTETGSHSYKQFVNVVIPRSVDLNITAFYLDAVTIELHVAFGNGDIYIFNWDDKNEEFEMSHTPKLETKKKGVCCFAMIPNCFYVLCTASELTGWNSLNSSCRYTINQNSIQSAISMEIYSEKSFDNIRKVHIVLLIHKNGVCKLTYEHDPNMPPKLEDLPIFTAPITCGKLSEDNRYLILGTEKGIIVYDLKRSKSLLPSNVSENIVCVDVFKVNDKLYIVLCGAKGKNVVNVHTLQSIDKDTVTWVHHGHEDNLIYSQAQLEPDVYLRSLLKKSEDGRTLYAVDTKARIHQIPMEVQQNTGNRGSIANWSIIATQKIGPEIEITALCVGQDDTVYTGYSNGIIININENKKLPQGKYCLKRISYLKEINSEIIIASSYDKTLIFSLSKPKQIEVPSCTFYARLFKNSYVILFMEQKVLCYDLDLELENFVDLGDDTLGGFDLKDNYMYLATRDSKLTIHELHIVDDKLLCKEIRNIDVIKSGIINYLTVSNDRELVAVGFKNGFIAIYKDVMSSEEPIYTIIQESSNVMRLRFSPCKQILVSCADQLCFWNVKYMLNNQITPKHRSTRHKHAQTKAFPGREEVDASPCTSDTAMQHQMHHTQRETDNKAYLWAHKQGFDKRSELLACIRFLGNEARHFYTSSDFSQFYVIDDEGSFYHLKVLEPLPEIPDHTAIERQLEMPHTEFNRGIDEQLVDNNDDDVGTDIIENIDLRPVKSRKL